MTQRRRLTFISPRFLFPADSGGKIRTTQILRGLKGGAFDIRLAMPATPALCDRHAADIATVCDELRTWVLPRRGRLGIALRNTAALCSRYPIPVRSDYEATGAAAVEALLGSAPDVVVFDFPHCAILAPDEIDPPSVMFTHNIEAEIFRRHWEVARAPHMKLLWRNQYRKMRRFERETLRKFSTTIAVSERDRAFFEREWDIRQCHAIPTGVDTEFFTYRQPDSDSRIVFCGSMDWMANIDGIEYFHDSVWPLIRQRNPAARMTVVGRTPPDALVRRIESASSDWSFTGFVDDVREYVGGAAVFVIPLRVGGGTRIKAFEAMAAGTPVVSTSIGMEGLPVSAGEHFLQGDAPADMAAEVCRLLDDSALRLSISAAARRLVEENYSFRNAASVFEDICLATADRSVKQS